MYKLFFKKSKLYLLIASFFAFASCQKDIDQTILNSTNQVPNLTTKVSSSVSGFVTDENGDAVSNATVYIGTRTVITDNFGYFSVKNTNVVKTAALVTVIKPGYFKGIKTYIAEQGKSAFFRIKLLTKSTNGSINSNTGGSISLGNGFTVSLPANSVVNASTGLAYSGSIDISAQWIDPTAADIYNTMPGDLRGISTDGSIKRLSSYGMAAVELTGTSGELLQIANGIKATLTFPIPASILNTAPNAIPLWYFDESNGLWKEEGIATKNGNTYVGGVSHFSFWNCDVPNNYIQMNCRILDANGNPMSYTIVKVSEVSNPYNARYGYTDSTGYVSGAVPDNAQLKLEVFTSYGCGTAAYAQLFSTTSSNISLGDIIVANTSTSVANVNGTVTDCNNSPLTNGYIIMLKDNQYYRYNVSNTGTFDFTTLLCSGSSQDVTFIAEDALTGQQSSPIAYTINSGNNVIANIQACGVTTEQFINYTVNGVNTSYTSPTDSFYMYVNTQTNPSSINISGQGFRSSGGSTTSTYTSFSFVHPGIAVGSTQSMLNFYTTTVNDSTSIITPVNVNITEYGNVGEFIGGNFSGTFVGAGPTSAYYTVSCTFRVRRTQ